MNVSRSRLCLFLGSAALWAALTSYSSNPPNGYTGAPGDGLCTNCHTGGSDLDGTVTLQGLPPVIMPNTTYTIQVTVSNPNGMAARAGFQWVALNDFNNNAGSMSNASASSVITPSGGRFYHEHDPAKIFGATSQLSWTANWTSPAAIPDDQTITLYAASVIGSGGDGSGGDRVVTAQLSAMLPAQGSPLSASITGVVQPSCNGGSNGQATVVSTGGSMPYSYLWSNGNTSATATNLTAGPVSVTVTDAGANSTVTSTTIGQPATIQLAATNVQGIDCDTPFGSATVVASGGTPGYTYAWPGGESGASAFSLLAGVNTVTVADANNCSKTLAVTISQNTAPPTAEAGPGGVLNCTFTQLTLSGSAPGCAGCTYSWAASAGGHIVSGGSSATPVVDAAGAYTLTVTNPSNGCTATDVSAVSQTPPVSLSLSSSTPVSCSGASDGTASIAALQGSPPYVLTWPSGDTSTTETGLAAGIYTVSVSDADGCTDTIDITIGEPPALAANLSFSDETAADADDGQAEVQPSGGTGPYTVSWSNGSTGYSVAGLAPAIYQVTVVDANGCQLVESFVVGSFDCAVSATIEAVSPTCYGAADGQATVSLSNATLPLHIQWSNGDTAATAIGLVAGAYSVTVYDANNCPVIQNFTIGEPTALEITVLENQPLTCVVTQSYARVQGSGGTAPYLYSWPSGQAGPLSDSITVPAGIMLNVVDANGCAASLEIPVTIDTELPAVIITNPDVVIPCGADSVSITAMVPSCDNCAFEWATQDGQIVFEEGLVAIASASGLYTFIATNLDNGCINTGAVAVTEEAGIEIVSAQATGASCFGLSDGMATVMAIGGDGTYTYMWESGGTNATETGLGAGIYEITVTGAPGCEDTAQVEVSEPPVLQLVVDEVLNASGGQANGAASVTVSGGVGGYSYQWLLDGEPFSDVEDIVGLLPGIYTLLASDANNCTIETEIEVGNTTAISDVEATLGLRLMPNPTSGLLWLEARLEAPATLEATLFNASGKEVFRQEFPAAQSHRQQLNLAALPAGMYYLRALSGKQVVARSLVVK
ncbi:MAG: T9SS type A sorting domain-containing protein [Phaeodactylibacter sp.]|nr:T9SS type A sorting domain-containing protein [Phaeodactylibacter sp.]MCB9274551.1 T9SS type A sorting domain-containing protein [Lewinellaceae bacterium]